ncbi:uncharacterized protein LOC144744709 isoform X2 [Ciona intestinalis]
MQRSCPVACNTCPPGSVISNEIPTRAPVIRTTTPAGPKVCEDARGRICQRFSPRVYNAYRAGWPNKVAENSAENVHLKTYTPQNQQQLLQQQQ